MKRVQHYVSLLVLLLLVGFMTDSSAQSLTPSEQASKDLARAAVLELQNNAEGNATTLMAIGEVSKVTFVSQTGTNLVNPDGSPITEKQAPIKQVTASVAQASTNLLPSVVASSTTANSVKTYEQLAQEYADLYPKSLHDITAKQKLYEIGQQMINFKQNPTN